MEFLIELWMPILLGAVFVFIASSVFHMVIPIHKNDHKGLPGEAEILALMREKGVTPGQYMFPHCAEMKDFGTEEFQAKWKQGPLGILRVATPADFNMGKNLLLWFVYCVIINVFAGYITWIGTIGAGAEYLDVFRLVGAVAFLAYGVAGMVDSLWKAQPWGITFKFMFEGLIYGLLTAGAFAWLWPELPVTG